MATSDENNRCQFPSAYPNFRGTLSQLRFEPTPTKSQHQHLQTMKKALSLAILLGAIHVAFAGSTNIYVENWGTGQSGVTGNGNLDTVGWFGLCGSQNNAPYLGIYTQGNATDQGTGNPLPGNTVYFTTLTTPHQVGPGMFYTTDAAGSGAGGNSTFTDITPSQYTNLTLNVEVIGGANATNYFAVQVGGQWYVSVTPMVGGGASPAFTNASLLYTNLASAWDVLTTNSTNVTIGAQAGANLGSPITGVGIVELPTSGGWDYNEFYVSVFAQSAPPPTPATMTGYPISQTVYAGGGAQFAVSAAGTLPLTYSWATNSVTLVNGSKYAGATNNFLTISNCAASDASATYSVMVTNVAGIATNTNSFSLTVNAVPQGWLYAETYPFETTTANTGANLALATVGWATAITGGGSMGIFEAGTGLGEVYSYSGAATTNAAYTTDTNDTGFSGLPFVDINPASYPAVTFQAAFSPGNTAGTVAGNVTAYWAVQMGQSTWYSSVQPIPINITAQNNYLTNVLAFSTVASNWNNLTINGATVTIGSQASGALTGNITGAGIVFTYPNTAGASMNWANFAITTNAAVATKPTINDAIGLYNQSVATGGGASFAVATSGGTQPFTYGWSLNGVMLTNGGRISGATSPTLTIANCTTNDSDPLYGQNSDTGNVIAYVSNSVGSDNSANYFPVSLQVTNAPVGILYSESFPYAGPAGNQPISSIGWTEAVPSTPNSVFELTALTGLGATFAYIGTPATTVYYATSATDTNQSGVPFPGINTAFYPSLYFSVAIAPAYQPTNVTAYLAVQFNSNNWYVATNPFPVPGTTSATYTGYAMEFNGAASNWKNLTVTSSGGIIGSAATSNLGGIITGAGLVFVTVGTGGTFNFDNFVISGTGLGGINLGALSGGHVNLSWVGNPAVNLQSTTNLSLPFQDVPNTLGLYSWPAPVTGPQLFFRLVQH
jgi:hypothetical protein